MITLPILKDEHPSLRQVSNDANPSLAHHRTLAMRMLNTMKEAGGIGLAAPQVGHNVRIIVFCTGTVEVTERVMFNPEILAAEGKKRLNEGCLSLPGKTVSVKRYKRIKVKYYNMYDKEIIEEFRNMPARVIQHEIDHLNGVLMTDHA